MAIAYYALAYNISFKSVDTWCQPDLDVIMFQGSEIYKAHKPSHSMYFSSDELPKKVKITSKTFDSNQVFGLEFSGYLHGLDSARDKSTLMHSVQCCLSEHSLFSSLSTTHSAQGFICTIDEFSVGLMKTNRGVFIFDSHKRRSIGRPCSNGKAVLLRFADESEACCYLVSMYSDLCERKGAPLPYELCLSRFVEIGGSVAPIGQSQHKQSNGVVVELLKRER